MKETLNYKLKKPEKSDVVNIDDINENMDSVDGLIKGNVNKIDILSGASGTVEKANKTDLDDYKAETIQELNKKLNKAGDTATGILKAHSNTSYTVAQVRNIILSSSNASVSSMKDGEIWIKYK